MEPKLIADQKTMEELFRNNLRLFPGARELVKLQIFRHDPSLVIDPHTVIAKYALLLKMDNGRLSEIVLRGSSDTTGYKRLKSYHILTALWANGFDRGINVVPRPLAYFAENHLLIYENVEGSSLIEGFKRPLEISRKKIEAAIDWLAEFHERKPKNIPEATFDWQKEKESFERLLNQLTSKFSAQASEITKTVEALYQSEKNLLRQDSFLLIHGDYQPNNIIFTPTQTVVIDYNDALLYDELFDLAYFLTQTKYMMKNLHKIDLTEFLDRQKERYFQLRRLQLDSLAQRKIALFTAQTLLRIKVLTTHYQATVLLKEIQNHVQKSV